MVKDIKYVIKRILIGVGIALILASLKGGLILGVQAMQVSSYSMGTNYYGVNNTTTRIDHSIEGNPWSVHANMSGYVNFNFSVMKVSGNSTAPLVQPRGVSVSTGGNGFICNFGTVSSNNSTFNSQAYSVRCPVTMSSSGLNTITILFQDFQANDTSDYRVTLTSGMSFEIVENGNVNVNVDTSNTTNAINNQITNDNNNTQSIINNQNSNKQDIINNQNSNTEKEIESQKVCTTYDNTFATLRGYINSSGEYVSDSSSSYSSNFIPINSSNSIKVLRSSSGNYRLCFYDDSKSLISCVQFKNYSVGSSIIIPNGSFYIRYALERSANAPRFELCKNGNQAVVDSQQNINNTLNDDTPVNNSTIEDLFGNIESSDTPISDLLTMPITLLQAYISGMSGTCNRIELGRLYGNLLFIPCINLESYLGTDLWSLIDIVLSMYLIYEFSQLLITAFDSITSLKDNFSWLFGVEAKHAGAPSTRVERNSDLY